jgi:hypothetical protein
MSKIITLYFKSLDKAWDYAQTKPRIKNYEYGVFREMDGDYPCVRVYDNKMNKTHVLIIDVNLYNKASYQERGE